VVARSSLARSTRTSGTSWDRSALAHSRRGVRGGSVRRVVGYEQPGRYAPAMVRVARSAAHRNAAKNLVPGGGAAAPPVQLRGSPRRASISHERRRPSGLSIIGARRYCALQSSPFIRLASERTTLVSRGAVGGCGTPSSLPCRHVTLMTGWSARNRAARPFSGYETVSFTRDLPPMTYPARVWRARRRLGVAIPRATAARRSRPQWQDGWRLSAL